MHFAHLDGAGADLDGAYTIGYRITDDGADPWTARFNRFKAKDQAAFIGGAHSVAAGMPALLKSLGVDPKDAVIVPALGSGETEASPKGQLSIMSNRIGEVTGASVAGGTLSKQVHKPIHNMYAAAERDAELDKAAYVSSKVKAKHVFVVDDLITRGSTLSRIATAIKAANPGVKKVYGIALGKTERRAFWGNLDNNHVGQAWDDRWTKGEQKFRDRQAKGK